LNAKGVIFSDDSISERVSLIEFNNASMAKILFCGIPMKAFPSLYGNRIL
jgi:hypothetical protein